MSFLRYLIYKFFKKIRLVGSRGSKVHKNSKLEAGTHFVFSSIDEYSYCGYDCEIFQTLIGRYTSIGNNVVLGGASHPKHWVSTSPVFYRGRDSINKKFSTHERPKDDFVNIGHDVWIGRSALVLPGVKIGNGAIVGAGSVVVNDVPPYAIAVGNPAVVKGYRFDDETIDRLLKIEWWNMSERQILKYSVYFTDVKAAVSEISKG